MTRTIWQDLYAVEQDNASASLAAHLLTSPGYLLVESTEGANDGDIGIQGNNYSGGIFGMPLTDHPNFKAPSGTAESEQARGLSQRHVREYNTLQTGDPAEAVLPMLGSAYNVSLFSYLLFQSGCTEAPSAAGAGATADITFTATLGVIDGITVVDGGTGYTVDVILDGDVGGNADAVLRAVVVAGVITDVIIVDGGTGYTTGSCVITNESGKAAAGAAPGTTTLFEAKPYTSANPEVYGIFTRFVQDAADSDVVDQVLTGAICTSLTLGSEVGGTLTMEATINSAKWEQADKSAKVTKVTFQNSVVPLKHQDLQVAFNDLTNWQLTYIPSWSITITNGGVFNFYNDDAAQSAHLGRVNVEGTMTIPWGDTYAGKDTQIDRFLDGATRQWIFFWGQPASTPWTGALLDTDFVYGTDDLGDVLALSDEQKNGSTDVKNYLGVALNIRVTDYEVVGDNELMVEVTFQGAYDGTRNAVEVYCAYDKTLLDRGCALTSGLVAP